FDKRQTPVAECVQEGAHDQDPFRTETIEERARRERYHRGRAHDRRHHQPRGRRREAADPVEVDDLERKDQSGAEIVERVPALQNKDRPRQARTPKGEDTCEGTAHSVDRPTAPGRRARRSSPRRQALSRSSIAVRTGWGRGVRASRAWRYRSASRWKRAVRWRTIC